MTPLPEPASLGAARLAVVAAAAADPELRCATLRLFTYLAWRYRPGRIWQDGLAKLAAEIGLAPRTVRLARQQLAAGGYIAAAGEGYVLPAIELALPGAARADPRRETGSQREMPFLSPAPASVRRYLEVLHEDCETERSAAIAHRRRA